MRMNLRSVYKGKIEGVRENGATIGARELEVVD